MSHRHGNSDSLRTDIQRHLSYSLGKDADHATTSDWRVALSLSIRDRIVAPWVEATRATYRAGAKRVYYLSMEFLIGRLLQDGIVNLGLEAQVDEAFRNLGLDLETVIHDEPDAALGNGGLGRLAACFLDSLSTLGIPAYGYGIRYEHGLFRQSFSDGRQIEDPENWLMQEHPWEFERPEVRYEIGFGGSVSEAGQRAAWTPEDAIVAQAYDTPIVGWQGRWANTLRLWSAKPVRIFDFDRFNKGEYAAAAEPEALARTISRALYPDDSTDAGQELRLKQEYFFTAASLQDLLRRLESQGFGPRELPNKVAIQLNDTHPAIAGPELVRLLHDERGVAFDEAVEIARGTLSYTNHTLLPEALESWPEALMARLLPRHVALIERIDAKHAKESGGKVRVRDHGEFKMGALSFIMSHKVNGVSALHTDLMKSTVFKDLHKTHPDRIVNQTNGVTPRRWLYSANPRLAGLITKMIGDGWVADLEKLEALEPAVDDAGFRADYALAKRNNKVDLSNWLRAEHGFDADPDAIFDVQIKRIHEYKRQHLNIIETVALWQAIRDNPNAGWAPRVKIFGGKAAPAYHFAKDIIRLIHDVAKVLNTDPETSPFLKVLFLPNYNVTMAERLIPASDLSEQISTAGKEASGTGNMKFALNGALTIGTLDGANVEIRERVGTENFFLFGMTTEQAEARRKMPNHAAVAIKGSLVLERALEAIRKGAFSKSEPTRHIGIVDNVSGPDYFLVSSDFADYWRAQRAVDVCYADRDGWTRAAALNTARSGWFSSDRTIAGYSADIWQTSSLLDPGGVPVADGS